MAEFLYLHKRGNYSNNKGALKYTYFGRSLMDALLFGEIRWVLSMLRHVFMLKIFSVLCTCLRFLCLKVDLNGTQESNQELT